MTVPSETTESALQSDGLQNEPPDASPVPSKDRRSASRGATEWVAVLGGAVLIALIIRALLIQAFYIPSESMESTLVKNDRVLVNKLSYRLHDVNRGDVVVFERTESQAAAETKDLIKRVIGIPGDSIVIDDATAKVIRNGEVIDEPYVKAGVPTRNGAIPCTAAKPCVVPTASIFVMGDNRTNSRDSRYIGFVGTEQIVGRAFVRVWPFSRLGGL